MEFTFQSGTIQAVYNFVRNNRISEFTFQSGTIQASAERQKAETLANLHSNLVQFKLHNRHLKVYLVLRIYIPIWYNSSGHENVHVFRIKRDLHSNLVQFKRVIKNLGKIGDPDLHSNLVQFKRMGKDISEISKSHLHSNLVQFKRGPSGPCEPVSPLFTFQSGTIQAGLAYDKTDYQKHLHSNLVQFKQISIKVITSFIPYLHSNLVQFKPRPHRE